RSSQAASYSRESNQLQAASQSLSRNQSSQAASDRQAALSGASAEANGGQEDSGDFFATYGTKKERRTVRKEAQVDDSAERNEEGEQGQKRSDSQEASVLRLDAQGRNEEGQQSLQRSGAKDAAAKSLAGAKNAQEAAKNRKGKSERKKARQARKEKANEAERKKDKKQRAKGSERAQSRERDSQNSQVPPPLPPKPSPKKKQNARLDAIERQLPELQNLLRTLQQDKSSSHGSESSASNVQPPEPARDAHRTQSTATEPVTFSKPAVPHANANVGTDENLFEHRSQSTETADFPSGLLGSVVASSESPSKRKTSQEAKSPPSKVWQPDPVLSDGSEIDENMTPSSQAPVHAPPASNHKPESNESDPNDLPIDEDNRSALCPEKSKKEGDTTVNTTEIYKTSTEHSKVSEKSRSEVTRELMDISEKEQYLSEIARLKSVVSELESRTFVQETIRIRESQPSSAPVHRRTVGLMVKPPCRDVAINIFIEEAKPAQRISTVSSQRLMFFQSLRQSYGISAAEMVNIITELLKRDVKSVGLQVCMDASPEPPGISSDVDELNREHGILKASDHFIDRKDTTSMRTYSSGSRFDSSVVKRRYETDYTTNSTSDSLERSTFDGDGDRLSSPDSGSSIKDSAQLSSITARTDSGWQGQEESSNQEFQFTTAAARANLPTLPAQTKA
uniref:Transcription termination factor 2 n=1 Tax=Macrostomum lignano TaxID=282301 RepID=A0A1I8J3T5_9PLAT